MHELGLCDYLLKTVDRVAKEEALTEVQSVTLEVGLLSGVVPRFMEDCWQAVVDGTPYENTALVIETINGIARCLDCGHEFSADLERLYCPKCVSRRITPVTGNDLTLKEIVGG
jgi:hydrogenase nickel incorporation protein HypA/HybF